MKLSSENVATLKAVVELELNGSIRSYSGRGMYGRECLGININCDPFTLGLLIGGEETLKEPFTGEKVETDNMGTGTIVYFPYIDAPTPTELGEDGDGRLRITQ